MARYNELRASYETAILNMSYKPLFPAGFKDIEMKDLQETFVKPIS